jgi:hypothetical protein
VLVALGLVAALGSRPIGRELAARPVALLGIAVVLAIAGAAYQLGRPAAPAGPPPLRAPDDRRGRG